MLSILSQTDYYANGRRVQIDVISMECLGSNCRSFSGAGNRAVRWLSFTGYPFRMAYRSLTVTHLSVNKSRRIVEGALLTGKMKYNNEISRQLEHLLYQ